MKLEPILSDLENQITNNLIEKITKKFDDLFIEGLKRKGFEFKNHAEMVDFIKNRCSEIDDRQFKQRIYSVDNIPFILHNYKTNVNPMVKKDGDITITADLGYYTFL